MNTNEVQTYPLNADKLSKGDTIDQETIANFLGVPRNSKAYELGVMGLADKVRRALANADKAVTVVITRRRDPLGPGAIRVLTDAEALRYNGRGFKLGLRKAARKHRKTMDIDPTQLTAEERKHFERSLIVQGAIMSGIAHTRAKAVLKCAERKSPTMLEFKSK
jgi:hypothetical protein